jgi:N-acetylneuraminic acid mutarotase
MKKLTGWTLLLTLVMTLAHASVFAQGRWIKLAPFPEPSEELLGASAGGKLYVFAGLAPGWKPKALVYEYDPATDKWTKKKPMALASHHVAITELKGKIYAFGGFVLPASGPAAWQPIDNAFEYDPAADSWKALAPMPTKRGAAGAAAVGDKVYVIGGATVLPDSKETAIHPARAHRSLTTVEEYDPATNTWRERSMMPTPRNHFAIGAVNGKIYVLGGRIGAAFISGGGNRLDLVEEYDVAANKWNAVRARMPTPRSAVAYGVHGGRVYVAGGEHQDYNLSTAFRAFEGFDAAKKEWVVMPPMPLQRHGLAGAVLGNRFHLVSGDVQSAGTGLEMHTDEHDAYEFESTAK